MRNIFRIFITDARRISKNVVAMVVIMGLCILPSLYAWFNIFSNWDPYGPDATSNLKVAVVSDDAGVSLAGKEVNIGKNVVDGLHENRSIGWVFTETSKEAIDGVYDGSYYAALVIPEDFTEEMISFLGDEIEHPEIIYYENAKKNAIAPKITQKAKTTVQKQVNAMFVGTLAETLMNVSSLLTGIDGQGDTLTEHAIIRLNGLNESLQNYINILNSFAGVMDAAQCVMETGQAMIPGLNSTVAAGQASVSSMKKIVDSGKGTAAMVSDMVNYSLNMVSSTLDGAATEISNRLAAIGNYGQGVGVSWSGVEELLAYLEEMFNQTVSGWEANVDAATMAQIEVIRAQFGVIREDIKAVQTSMNATPEQIVAICGRIPEEILNCRNAVIALKDKFTNAVKPQLDATVNEMQNSLTTTADILKSVDVDFGGVEQGLADFEGVLNQGQTSLSDSAAMAQGLLDGLKAVTADLVALQNNEQYLKMMEIMQSDPEFLGEFVSSPVQLETVGIYKIENYGSAMTPFYTILALWVGALILVAIIHVKVHPVEGLKNVKPYQEYFGRYILFFLVGQVQTLITVLGNLYYIRIQCHAPFLFWLAASVSSLVFTLFIYSLTVAFGNVGEALAIVVMVIQVAGAGGTFPIETLPKVYQTLYKYLPFPYGMNAMRETIGGSYQSAYWEYLLAMCAYILVSLVIGLVLAKPFRKLNHIIEESKEKSGVMI